MRVIIAMSLFVIACIGQTQTTDKCKDLVEEHILKVSSALDVYDDEETFTMTNGCVLTTITHYVLNDSGGGDSGNDPFGCDYALCDPALSEQSTYSDPAPDSFKLMNTAHSSTSAR